MIRLKSTVDVTPLDDMIAFLDDIQAEIADIGQEVIDETAPALLAELDFAPPRRSYPDDYPLEWTSDRQRKAYFATDGFGAGIPFERTGTLQKSFTIVGVRRGNVFEIVIENKKKGAPFVFGSLAQNLETAKSFQQRFHEITGWKLAQPIVMKWVDEAQALMFVKIRGRMGSVGTAFGRRAYTRGRQRRR